MQNNLQENNRRLVPELVKAIAQLVEGPLSLMEVCGTHTVAISRSGLRQLLPPAVRLISGPGCPVCVTGNSDLEQVIQLSRRPGVILATFGDMVRVPVGKSSLQKEKGLGADVRVIYSALDALRLAGENPMKDVVLLGIGFETTTPTVAATLETALQRGIKNFSVFSVHKTIPPALEALFSDPEVNIDGLINPGHVCAITGTGPFRFIPEKYRCPCVSSGFEPADILEAILMLARQHREGVYRVDIQYRRVVRPEGNRTALDLMDKYFVPADSEWRGLGVIPASGLAIRKEYALLDARERFGLAPMEASFSPSGYGESCRCGEILKGKINPADCPLFGNACNPVSPFGPCMVSSEGVCAAHYRYGRHQ